MTVIFKSTWEYIIYHDWIGKGNNPNVEPKGFEGSEYLLEVSNKEDDRPIFVQMWGQANLFCLGALPLQAA
jgi:hypothetical protein